MPEPRMCSPLWVLKLLSLESSLEGEVSSSCLCSSAKLARRCFRSRSSFSWAICIQCIVILGQDAICHKKNDPLLICLRTLYNLRSSASTVWKASSDLCAGTFLKKHLFNSANLSVLQPPLQPFPLLRVFPLLAWPYLKQKKSVKPSSRDAVNALNG